jgi:hypothetical protein
VTLPAKSQNARGQPIEVFRGTVTLFDAFRGSVARCDHVVQCQVDCFLFAEVRKTALRIQGSARAEPVVFVPKQFPVVWEIEKAGLRCPATNEQG